MLPLYIVLGVIGIGTVLMMSGLKGRSITAPPNPSGPARVSGSFLAGHLYQWTVQSSVPFTSSLTQQFAQAMFDARAPGVFQVQSVHQDTPIQVTMLAIATKAFKASDALFQDGATDSFGTWQVHLGLTDLGVVG